MVRRCKSIRAHFRTGYVESAYADADRTANTRSPSTRAASTLCPTAHAATSTTQPIATEPGLVHRWCAGNRMTAMVETPSPTPPPLSDLATLHALPISERPRKTWAQFSNGVAFGFVFNLGCVLINVAQFLLLLPLKALCFVPFGRRLYDVGIRRSKGAFGTLLGEGSERSILPRTHTPLRPPPLLGVPSGAVSRRLFVCGDRLRKRCV